MKHEVQTPYRWRCFSSFFPSSNNTFLCSPGHASPEHRNSPNHHGTVQTIMGHLHPLGWIRVHVLSLMQQLWVIIDGFNSDNTIRQAGLHSSNAGIPWNKCQDVAQAAPWPCGVQAGHSEAQGLVVVPYSCNSPAASCLIPLSIHLHCSPNPEQCRWQQLPLELQLEAGMGQSVLAPGSG